MRPLRLELKGFTAFRDAMLIDFADLDVFAISGPTGSGKSSLLDAMTYALYGRVERVGGGVKQLISQGQPRMAVTLDFIVGSERYRVTRTTFADKRATKIMLVRLDGDAEISLGEGADRVGQAEDMIERLIGLTYDGFTRSVLLPQGRFAEFLTGDAKKRREILTELLGLGLFQAMAKRAGAIEKESSIRAQERGLALEREYADVNQEALRTARQSAKDAAVREQALAAAAEQVVAILGRWQEAERTASELRACADEASGAASQAREAAGELAALAERLEAADAELAERDAGSRAALEAHDAARTALREAVASGGTATELAEARVAARALAQAERARAAKAELLAEAVAAGPSRVAAAETAEARREDSRRAVVAGEAALANAEESLEQASHADLVATISSGLKAGDPCPVCGLPLEQAPAKRGARGRDGAARALQAARKAVDGAKRSLERARAAASDAERAADAAGREVQANAAEQDRITAELASLDAQVSEERDRMVTVLGEPMPPDPAAAIDERIGGLDRLDRAERDASERVAEEAKALVLAEQGRERVIASVTLERQRLSVDRQPLLDRATRALGNGSPPTPLPRPPADGDPDDLRAVAEAIAGSLGALAERLATEADARSSNERSLLREASAAVGALVEPVGSLSALARAVEAACRNATGDVAAARARATELAAKVARKKQLAQEAQALEDRARLLRALALELRADRMIAFLQSEALQMIAAAGAERLASISDGRYRLVCHDDEFLVVDTWNGDEERSVRTLSGGETFLASLALALALADQVRSLSVTDRARVDSLFLDEGFGTLDAETLRVVVEAIEQLGSDGRLVGVITHVPDLAEQFTRFEVRKERTGSTVALVP